MAKAWDFELFNKSFNEIDLHPVISIEETTKTSEVIELMASKNIGCVPVSQNGKLAGIFTEIDFALKCVNDNSWSDKPISEFMTASPFSLGAEMTIMDAMKIFFKKSFRHIPIVDNEQKVKAVISVKDILKYVLRGNEDILEDIGTLTDWSFLFVDKYTENFSFDADESVGLNTSLFFTPLKRLYNTKGFLIVDKEILLKDAVSLMLQKKETVFLVQEFGTKLIGIFTERDLLRKIRDKNFSELGNVKLSDYMTKNPDTLLHKHYLGHALNNMFSFNYRNIIIVDEDNFPLGQFNLLDVVKFLGRGLVEKNLMP